LKRILIALGIVLAIGLIAVAQGKIVIGHRGAAGYVPEETIAGYAFGYALGADYLEPDLVMTKDAHFICMHDIYLEPTTDVEQVFPDRRRADGHWYAARPCPCTSAASQTAPLISQIASRSASRDSMFPPSLR